MTDIEFAAQIVACIKVFDSPYQGTRESQSISSTAQVPET